jgi:hypothetical protein
MFRADTLLCDALCAQMARERGLLVVAIHGASAKLCGVRWQSVYWWIKEWKVERLVDALKLSQASGIPVEKFAGQTPTRNRPRKTNEKQESD